MNCRQSVQRPGGQDGVGVIEWQAGSVRKPQRNQRQAVLPDDTSFITDEVNLRALHHQPMSRATDKVLRTLDQHCLRIISLSPFCVISTQGADGADISPRGDPAGFVKVIDERTLLVPDRVGNNRLDAMANLLVNPRVGLLFLIPGMNETLRINGTARITDDSRLLAPCAINGRPPRVGLVIAIDEAFMHCPKAFIRSALWDATKHIDRKILPSYAEMLFDHVKGITPEENERQTQVMAERGLY
jgi:PPOX class probable FMN-dependent enzyme